MRRVGAWIVCAGLAALLGGCGDYLHQYFEYSRQGAGTTLDSTDSVQSTRLLENYVDLICQQAGLPLERNPDGTFFCRDSRMGAPEWGLFVQAGMNDIDRRCDAYLAWLDDQRRSSEPILNEIALLGAAAASILQASSAGAKSIALVGVAFGLAGNTFTNINKRLLLSVNQSTVESVVLDHQQDFRAKMQTTSIDNRPAALYVLRGYLRICTPFYIEASINNTITIYHRSGPSTLNKDNSPFTAAPDLAKNIIRDATRPIDRPSRTPFRPEAPSLIGDTEKRMAEKDVGNFRKLVCLDPSGGLAAARAKILDYLIKRIDQKDPSQLDRITARDVIILRREVRKIPPTVLCPF